MGDNGRRRGSVRDVVDEDLPHYSDRGRYREYSALPQNDLTRSRHHSRLSSWEEKGEPIVKNQVDMAETRERSHNSGYYRSTSPHFDGLEQQKCSNAPDKQGSQSHRYEERRSSRRLEKSRSRSPGWGRSRNYARDRSRSRSKGSVRGRSRSRSKCYDQGSKPHRWSDRKSGPGRSSQTCKDFVVGICRRGSQCRFLHSDNILRDDESLDSDTALRWKGKEEPGRGSKYQYDKNVDKFSDAYNGETDPSRGRPRGAIICRDFVKGNCRYGESCRFSHSAEHGNVDRSYRNVDIDPDHGLNSNKSRSNLCKFFLAGNCRRDNCRFSHDTSLSSVLEDRIHNKSGGETVGKLEEWKGPLWDEPEKPANTRKISQWGALLSSELEDKIHNNSGGETVGKLEEWKSPLWDEPEKPANTRKISKWGAPLSSELEDKIHNNSGGETVGTLEERKGPLWDEPEKPADNRKISKWGAPLSSELEDRVLKGSGWETVGTLEEWKCPRWDEPEKPANTGKISKCGAPLSSELEDRINNKSGGETVGILEEWKGPLCCEPEKPANTRKISKWGTSIDANMELSDDVSVDRRGDERWGGSLEHKTKFWEHDNQFLDRNNCVSNSRTNDENSRRIYASETMVIERSLGEPQEMLPHEEFRSHTVDKLAHISNHNHGGEAVELHLSSPSANPQVSMTSDTRQYQGMTEHNRGPVLESGGLYELKDCRTINGQSVNPEIRSSFCDTSSLLNMNGQQMLQPISDSLKVDLTESGHVVFPPNLNEQISRKQSTIEHMPEPSALSSLSVQAPNALSAPHNTSPIPASNVQNIPAIHVAKSFLGEFKTQLHTVLESSTLREIAPSLSLLHPLPADYPQNVSNSTRSHDQHPVLKNETVYADNDQKARELLSSLSMIDSQLSTLPQIGDSKLEGNNILEDNLHEATKELKVNDGVEKCNMSSKMEADNYGSNRADDQGKEGGNNNKDEKVIRLFKNALVELVKDILKPKWKEGKMSREIHKTVVKKVVDKVTVAIQAEHVPNTQEKVEQYLSSNRPKISKLVQAYVERSLKGSNAASASQN